jgi:hypothetical protein
VLAEASATRRLVLLSPTPPFRSICCGSLCISRFSSIQKNF